MKKLIVRMQNKEVMMELQSIGNIVYKSPFINCVCMEVEDDRIDEIKDLPGVISVREEREGVLLS